MSLNDAPSPEVVSVEMGYGHLRAALPLIDALGGTLLYADEPPLCDPEEQRLWGYLRRAHELLSKPTQLTSWLGIDPTQWMDRLTNIPPLYAQRDQTHPNAGTRALDFLITRGLGRGLVEHLQATGVPLVTTFYAPAIVADRAGIDRIYCVVTDADINRVWAPKRGQHSRIRYFAPSPRVIRRLQAYGVPRDRITMTGFPLPVELLGGRDLGVLRKNLARRLVRLDPCGVFRELFRYDVEHEFGQLPADEEGARPRLLFAVGGAGAQAEMAFEFLPSLRDAIVAGHLEVTLVAGIRSEVVETFTQAIERAGLGSHLERGVSILHAPTFEGYYRRFNEALADTDILWTKPSELSFYAGLGIPLVLAKPVGSHERFNRRWLRDQGVALKQRALKHTIGWLDEWLNDGTLAAAAWSGFVRLPKDGTYQIVARIQAETGAARTAAQ